MKRFRKVRLTALTEGDRREVVDAYRLTGSVLRARQIVSMPLRTVRKALEEAGELDRPIRARPVIVKPPFAPPREVIPVARGVEKLNPYVLSERYLIAYCEANGLPARLSRRHGLDFIDGVPVTSVAQRMRAVNQERVRLGEPQVGYSGDWVV